MPCTVSPRRITSAEEEELLAADAKAKTARDEATRGLLNRDRLIAELIDSGCRIVDIADVLGLSAKAVRDAKDRALRS